MDRRDPMIDKGGRVRPLRDLEAGDRIVRKEWDVGLGCLVLTVELPGVPPSPEVAAYRELELDG
jgi:hypothetical protein